jgi:hypothetical protein
VEDRSTGNLTRRLLIRRAVCECVVYSSGSVEPYVKRYGVIPGIRWAIEIISSAVPQYQGVVERFSSPGNEVEPPPTHGGPGGNWRGTKFSHKSWNTCEIGFEELEIGNKGSCIRIRTPYCFPPCGRDEVVRGIIMELQTPGLIWNNSGFAKNWLVLAVSMPGPLKLTTLWEFQTPAAFFAFKNMSFNLFGSSLWACVDPGGSLMASEIS